MPGSPLLVMAWLEWINRHYVILISDKFLIFGLLPEYGWFCYSRLVKTVVDFVSVLFRSW